MRILFATIGTISLILGVLGIFLPILPTTPFLLLAAALYLKASPKLYEWLLSNKYLGTYIKNFREYHAIPLKTKIVSIALLWLTLFYCALFTTNLIWLKLLFIAIAIGVTIHILSYKTLKK